MLSVFFISTVYLHKSDIGHKSDILGTQENEEAT